MNRLLSKSGPVLLLCLFLGACGGGGSSAPAQTAPLALMMDSFGVSLAEAGFGGGDAGAAGADGGAGDGAAIPNAQVKIIDNAGHSVTGRTDVNGVYHVRVDGFVPPMIAVVTKADGSQWYSPSVSTPVVRGFVNINLTGLTDKLAYDMAVAAGKSSSAQLTTTLIASNPGALDKAKADLNTALSAQIVAAGLDPAKFDPVTMPLVTNGKGYDQLLDNLVISNTPSGPTVIGNKYSLGGSISGLGQSAGLSLSNGTDTLAVAGGATRFTLSKLIAPGTAYNLQISSQPSGLVCSISGGSGVMGSAAITSVSVLCASAAAPIPSATASLPADLLLQPATASCPALRSGTYRLVVPQIGLAGSNGSASTETTSFNATTQVITLSDGSTHTLTAMAGSPCRFTSAGNTAGTSADIVVSQAGVVGVKTVDGFFGVLFQEQTIPVSDLAGDWNWLGFDRKNLTDPLAPSAASLKLDGAGATSNVIFCPDAKTCTPSTLGFTLTVNPAGGYDINFLGNSDKSRAFAYRAGGGELMIVGVGQDGTWAFLTKQRTNSLPTAGTVNTGWNVGALNALVNGAYQQSAFDISDYQNTITSVDSTANSFKRDNVINFTGPVTRSETVLVNAVVTNARPGYNYRTPEAVLNSAGANSNVVESIFLPFRGMGFNAIVTGTNQFSLSIAKP